MNHVSLLLIATLLSPLGAQEDQSGEIEMLEALVLPSKGQQGGRTIFHSEPVELAIVQGEWQVPAAGDVVEGGGTWMTVAADGKGWIGHPESRVGYVYWEVESAEERVATLAASGHSLVYAGIDPAAGASGAMELRTGNPYRKGYVRVPVALRAGKNGFLFRFGRGAVKTRLLPATAGLSLSKADGTLPDLIREEAGPFWGALPLTNSTSTAASWLVVAAAIEGGDTLVTVLPQVGAMTVRKVGFRLPAAPATSGDRARVKLTLLQLFGEPVQELELDLRVRSLGEQHRRTFVSEIDGSVQYYAVKPAEPVGAGNAGKPRPALFLSLHGASVEANGQVGSYSPKTWGHLVAPTNRRPFGFDWEDWGRWDAIEVLDHAAAHYGTDPLRTYLTGHSMGGHGTWHLGVTFPGRFAAIGPSAGWISFRSYAGAPSFTGEGSIEQIFARATSPSDTLGLAENLAPLGVYVLHGDADDNVPVTEARKMREHLSAFHEDLHYHEQPGAGHWWGSSDEPGAECCDWGPMFDLFARRSLPSLPLHVDFRTASPGVSADCHWLRIEAQQHDLAFSHARIRLDPGRRRFVGTTENVARLSLSVAGLQPRETVRVELDLPVAATEGEGAEGEGAAAPTGLDVPWPVTGERITLRRSAEGWQASPPAATSEKGPHRHGLFRDAFKHRAALVYGTAGTPEENTWAYARARYDNETFWVRGNGSFDLISDQQFLAGAVDGDRNVILYGNADTNAAWGELLADCPVRVARGQVTLGDKELAGDDLLALFLYPRPQSNRACVAAVAGTGLPGMRLADRLPYFVSGVGLPDLTVLGTDMLAGQLMGAVRAAGFFGADWGLDSGDMVYDLGDDF